MNGRRRYREWTADDTATLKCMARAGYSVRATAARLNRDHAQICRKMQQHDVQPGISPLHLAALARINMRRRLQAA